MSRFSISKMRRGLVHLLATIFVVAAAATAAAAQVPNKAEPVLVFAAASLKNALDAIKKQWEADSGNRANVSLAASSTLAKQIEQAAPADIFISADLAWMEYLAARGLIRPGSLTNLLSNRIVLIAPKGQASPIDVTKGLDLATRVGAGRLAMANVQAVPAGRYGKAALQKLGAWDAVAGKVAQADNVRAALLLVSRGEAPLGIVYQTDAAADPNVAIVGTFPEDSHPPIVYPIALVASSRNPNAAVFLDYIKSARAKPLFEVQGFSVIGPGGT